MIDGVEGWVGVSHQKRTSILEAGLLLISHRRPLVGAVDRWVGKLSFALGFRTCARSVYYKMFMHGLTNVAIDLSGFNCGLRW